MGGFYRDDTTKDVDGANPQTAQHQEEIAFANGAAITEKPKRKKRRGKKKKRHGGDGTTDGANGHSNDEEGEGVESVSDGARDVIAVGGGQNGHLNGGSAHGVEAKGNGYQEGGAVQSVSQINGHDDSRSLQDQRPMTTPDDWQDVDDAIPISMDQLINGPVEPTTEDTNRNSVEAWLNNYISMHPTSLSLTHRNAIIDHMLNHKFPGTDPTWPSTIRQTLWRAVIRASYFWVNPETGETIKKILPIHRPDGIYENDFKVFLMCAAERADRVGRDLPTEEHTKMIESAVRMFFWNAEKAGMRDELECLGFVLMFDEEHRRVLGFDDLRERIKWAFDGKKVDWEGCEIMKSRKVKVNITGLKAAMRIWEDAQATL